MNNIKGFKIRKIYRILIVLIVVLSAVFVINENDYVDNESLKNTLTEINTLCNNTLEDVDSNETVYLELLKSEEDPLKRGMYLSALTLIYTVKGDYEKVVEYGENAVENYLEVENGEYYAIAEYKYLAWSMLRSGRYADSFKISSELLKIIDNLDSGVLTIEEVTEIEALVYSIFICIYTDVDLPNKAKIYYDKLCEIELTDEIKLSIGDRIAYSKIVYAYDINDYELLKKYTQECYDVLEENDKKKGMDSKDSVILNIGIANVLLGNLEEGLNQINQAEEYYNRIGDKNYTGTTYAAYAKYYSEIGDVELAFEYYNQAIEKLIKTGDSYRIEDILTETIIFMEENKISEKRQEYYSLYYSVKKSIKEDKALNKLLVETININNELNSTILKYMEKEDFKYKLKSSILIIMAISLFILIKQIYSLIRVKEHNNDKLEEIANKDYLTGANTRRYGISIIEQLIIEKRRFSVGILDIDDFKNINDKCGHVFGDYILKNIVSELQHNLSEEKIIIRFGGEEFLIAFINKDKNKAKIELDIVREKISKIKFNEGLVVNFSCGICDYTGGNLEVTIEKIDKLLYAAKRNGKNRIEI